MENEVKVPDENRFLIGDKIWEKIECILPIDYESEKQNESCKLFIQAVLFTASAGLKWREIPKSLGNWNSIYYRFNRWESNNIWLKILKELDTDLIAFQELVQYRNMRGHLHHKSSEKKAVVKHLANLVERINTKERGVK